jgi:hypothetical protein
MIYRAKNVCLLSSYMKIIYDLIFTSYFSTYDPIDPYIVTKIDDRI